MRATWAIVATLMTLGMLVIYGALFYFVVEPSFGAVLSMSAIDCKSSLELPLDIMLLTLLVYYMANRMRDWGKIQSCKHA